MERPPAFGIRKRTETISLGDFDPAKIEQSPANTTDENNDLVFMVQMERSDSERKIPATLEMTDGSKTKVLLVDEQFLMDTYEAAGRFQKALTHAATLCGGKRSPF